MGQKTLSLDEKTFEILNKHKQNLEKNYGMPLSWKQFLIALISENIIEKHGKAKAEEKA